MIKRYHFAITDDIGNIIYHSSHIQQKSDRCLFSPEIFSSEHLQMISDLRSQCYEMTKLVLEDRQTKNAVILISNIFPSTRTYILIFTDIKYKTLGTKSSKTAIKSISEMADIIFPSNYNIHRIISEEQLRSCIKLISVFSGCELTLRCHAIPEKYFDGLDSELFSLFMLGVTSAASEFSDIREGSVTITTERLRLKITVEFTIPGMRSNSKSEFKETNERFSDLFRYIRALSDRKNIPLSVIFDENFKCEIIPHSPEVSFLGIKEPQAYLKSFDLSSNEKENKE